MRTHSNVMGFAVQNTGFTVDDKFVRVATTKILLAQATWIAICCGLGLPLHTFNIEHEPASKAS